ncbi:uncharacterized protein LOC121523908 [Cheilinus undulatus]|uniref:uncharacterized protein LOC121523908 n=1 Tax=Cheilinus undulatus TaxID=241271 RepID=UPI001BD4386A|nr:uncharacterized protein LOC121523908 [Cheilinus undulatus]
MHHSIIIKGTRLGPTTPSSSEFGCPLCPRFRTAKASVIKRHLENHATNGVHFHNTIICRCNQTCRDRGHFHCPFCFKTMQRKEDMKFHVTGCQKRCDMVQSTSVPPFLKSEPSSPQEPKSVTHPPLSALEDCSPPSVSLEQSYTPLPSACPSHSGTTSEPPGSCSSSPEEAVIFASQTVEPPSARVDHSYTLPPSARPSPRETWITASPSPSEISFPRGTCISACLPPAGTTLEPPVSHSSSPEEAVITAAQTANTVELPSLIDDHSYTRQPSPCPSPEVTISLPPDTDSSSPEDEVTSAPKTAKTAVLAASHVKCPHCPMVLYKKNLVLHIRRKHEGPKVIRVASCRKRAHVDKSHGQKNPCGFSMPVQRKTLGQQHVTNPEREDCQQSHLFALWSGLSHSTCDHVRSLQEPLQHKGYRAYTTI